MTSSVSPSKEYRNSYSSSNYPLVPSAVPDPQAPVLPAATGPDPYNMDPANRNFSLDTLHVSLYILCKNSDVLKRLPESKKEIQDNNQDEAPFNLLSNGSTNFTWSLQRTGVKNYPYVLRKGDLILFLSTRSSDSAIPNAKLQVGSISSNSDPSAILKEIRFWLSCEGLIVIKEKVSRFDICADRRVDIRSTHIEKQDRHITRAVHCSPHYAHRKITGCSVGRGEIQCRIYDKQAEMASKGDLEKQLFFWAKWGVGKEEPITRVEFQVRGDAINQFFNGEKPTLDELILCLPGLWKYLTEDWLRITQFSATSARSTNTQHRLEVSHFWKGIQAASSCVSAVVRRAKKTIVNTVRLVQQAGGCLISAAAALGVAFSDKNGIAATFTSLLGDWWKGKYPEPGFQDLYQSRQQRSILL